MSSVNIVNAAGLAANSSRLLAGADAETVLYAEQIRDSESRTTQFKDQIAHSRTLREAISRRLDQLRLLESAVSAATDSEGKLGNWCELSKEIDNIAGGNTAMATELNDLAAWGGGWKATINVTDGTLNTRTAGCQALVRPGSSGQPIQAEIKRLEGEISQLDGDRQLQMVQLNQEINNKNKVVNLLTNLLKAKNDAARMILSNLRPG